MRDSGELVTERTWTGGEPALSYAEGPDNGPPLVLLHGIGGRWQAWQATIPRLVDRWHVFAVDLRGHGKSGRANSYTFADYPPDIADFVSNALAARAVIWGHSLGAMTAIGAAGLAPDFVSAVVLEDPPMFIAGRPEHSPFRERFARNRDLRRRTDSEQELFEGLRAAEPETDEEQLRFRARSLAALDPEVYGPPIRGRNWEEFDVDARLRAVAAPALLLQGNTELGGVVSDADAARAFAALPNGRHVKFAHVGHGVRDGEPEGTLLAVDEFLAEFLPCDSAPSS